MGNTPSSVPLDAQLSAVNASLQCRYLNTNVARAVYASTTAPLVGSEGDQVYFADVVANLYLPTPAKSAALTLTFSVSNASPSLYSVSSKTIARDIAFQSGTLPPIGPFTLANGTGDASTFVNFGIHSISGTIDGNTISCGQSFDYIVASVVSYGTTQNSTVRSASRGKAGPGTPLGTRFGAINGSAFVNTDTQLGLNRPNEYNFQFEGYGPTFLKQGQAFNFTNYKEFFTVSGDLINALTNKGSDTYSVAVSTTTLPAWMRNTNHEQDYDINKYAVGAELPLRTARSINGPSSQSINFALPNSGSLTLTNVTATGNVGSTVSYFFPGVIYTVNATGVNSGKSSSSYVLFTPNLQHRLFTAPIVPANTVIIPA